MAVFSIETPSGKILDIEAPDQATALRGAQEWHAQNMSGADVALDVAKGAGTGLAEGTMSLAGLPGDAGSLMNAGADAIGSRLGIGADKVEAFKQLMKASSVINPVSNLAFNGPTSAQIKEKFESNIGKLPQPVTDYGKYAKTAGEFAPAMIGGPGSLAVKGLTRVAAPTIGSEAAGALTEGTAAEPYARIGGALIGSAGATKATNVLADRAATKIAPSTAELKKHTSDSYDALTASNVAPPGAGGKMLSTIVQGEMDSVADDITKALNAKGVRPSVASQIHAAVNEIKTPATKGGADVADLVASRQNIKHLLGAPDANKAGAFIALPKIEQAIERLSPGTMQKLREADKNWAVVKANEALDKKMARAELRAAGEGSGLNMGNKIRQKVTDYLVSNEARYLSKEQREALEKVVRGTASQNIMRWASNLMGGGGGLGSTALGLGGAAAGTYSGHPELALVPVAGLGARMISNRLTAGQAANAAASLRNSSPYGRSLNNPAALPKKNDPLLQGLLSGLLAAPPR
jgi:hypothetical protein